MSDEAAVAGEIPVPSSRRWDVWIGLAAGLAVGLLVHRYVVLPFVVERTRANVLLWVALGLLMGAGTAYRLGLGTVTAGIVTPMRVGIGLVSALVGAAAGFAVAPPVGFLPLDSRKFPGFEIPLPSGKLDARNAGDYDQGQLNLYRPGGMDGGVLVQWEPGKLFDDDDVATAAKAFGAAFGGVPRDVAFDVTVAIRDRLPSRSWFERVGAQHLWTTQVICGARSVVITTAGESWSTERLHRRIIEAFHCLPDSSQEAFVGDIPVVFDSGPGWFRLPSAASQLQLTDRTAVIMMRPLVGRVSPDQMAEVLAKAFPGFEIGKATGDRWPISLSTGGGESQKGWLEVRFCADWNQTLFLMWASAIADPNEANRTLRRIRCRAAREAPQKWTDLRLDQGER